MWSAEIFIVLAAILKAIADTIDHHFDTSIFKKLNPRFWDMDVSTTAAKRIFKYKIDAWHLSQSLMTVLMIAAVVLHVSKATWWIEILTGGLLWNLTFNLFYNKILRRK